MDPELARLPGAAETELTAEVLARLPDEAPPAPWSMTARAVAWWNRPDERATDAIRETLPPALRDAKPLTTVAALVSYLATPVGAYDEIVALVVLRRRRTVFAHVPFIAVSSPASLVAGRANWSLPKTLATFDGLPADSTEMTANGDGWRVGAVPRPRSPAVPFLLPPLGRLVQIDPVGAVCSATVRGRGRAHLAEVTAEVTASGGVSAWLPKGRCTGLLCPKLTGYLPAAMRHDA